MVSRKRVADSTYYICSQCGFVYASKEKAMECEKWCVEHGSCNLAITKDSVQF